MRIKQTLLFAVIMLLISSCTTAPPQLTLTPTMCTGWHCTLEGVVYLESADPGNELADQPVTLKQISNCSSTAGEYETATDQNGHFTFDVYLHDTDSFVVNVILEGAQPAQHKLGGFDCLYCSCPPVEIILQSID